MNNVDHFQNEQLLLHAILMCPEDHSWTVQGLGMLRLYLSDAVRIHIWHSSLVVPEVTSVHEHPWDFESLVLCGELRNHKYIPAKEGEGTPYYRDMLLCGTGNLADDPQPVWLQPWYSDNRPAVHKPMSEYSQRYDEIHETFFEDGTVTLVRRRFVNEDRDHAYVYWERGAQFVSAEPRAARIDEIAIATGASARLLGREAGLK